MEISDGVNSNFDQSHSAQANVIHGGHFMLIASCALCLIFLTVMKNGFHFAPQNRGNNLPALTYAQAKQLALADMGPPPVAGADTQAQDQIAMLDPTMRQGSVLGTSTGTSDLFPSAESVFTPDALAKIKINLLNDSNADLVKAYADQVIGIESESDTLSLLSTLGGQDKKALSEMQNQTKQIVAKLAAVPVPSELADYHKMKMIYYTTMGDLGTNLAGGQGLTDMESDTTLFFSLNDKIERTKGELLAKYNVTLP